MVPIEGRFDGALIDGPGPCYGGNPVNRRDIIKRVRLDRLTVFFGAKARVTKVEEPSDDTLWTVWIKVGPEGSRHSLYAFYLNECGYITGFSVRN